MEIHELSRGQLLRIEDGLGVMVRVARGCVWITEEGDVRDRFVSAGQSFPIGSGGVTLISALTQSAVVVTAAEELVS